MSSNSREQLVSVSDEHWMIYVVPVFICILLFAAAVLFLTLAGITVTHSEWLWQTTFVFGTGFLLISLHGFFLILLGESVSQIVITNKRVVRFHNIIMFRDEMLEVSYEKMKTVEARKLGLLRNLLNYGTLHFENNAVIDYVSHPNRAARDIEQQLGNL